MYMPDKNNIFVKIFIFILSEFRDLIPKYKINIYTTSLLLDKNRPYRLTLYSKVILVYMQD